MNKYNYSQLFFCLSLKCDNEVKLNLAHYVSETSKEYRLLFSNTDTERPGKV